MKRVLLDENLPRQLKRELTQFDVRTVAEVGWAGTKNGQLLRLAESQFDVFVTADRNLPQQQSLASISLAVIVLAVGSVKLEELREIVPEITDAILRGEPGMVLIVQQA